MQDDRTWLVKLDDGNVRSMDLDQLDAAYQNGVIHEYTLVRQDGAERWMKLSEELGAHEEPPSPSSTASTAPVALPSSPDAPDDLEAMLRSSRRKRRVLWSAVAVAVVGGLSAVTVVNVLRLRPHGPVIAEVPITHVAAPSDPEPVQTAHTDPSKDPKKLRKSRTTQPAGDATQAPQGAPASTVFTNGGEQYDPLNAKL